MSSFSFNPNSLQGMAAGSMPFGGAQGLSSPFASFFGGSGALGQLTQQVNPKSFGGNIFEAFLEDHQKTNQALGQNFQRGLEAEQGLMSVLQGLPGRAQDFSSQLQDLVTGAGEQITGTAEQHLGDITDWATDQISNAQSYLDRGIDQFSSAISEYDEAQTALQAGQALAQERQTDQFLQQALSGEQGNLLTPEQKAGLIASVNNTKMQNRQAEIGKLQARTEDVILQSKGALSQLMQQAGSVLGGLGVQFGQLIQRGQQGVQAAQQFVANLKTQSQLQGRQLELQAEQLALGGYQALASMISNNKLMFASAGPVAMAAANLAQMGLNPFGGGQAQGAQTIRDMFQRFQGPTGFSQWANMSPEQRLYQLFSGGGGQGFQGGGYPTWYVPPNISEGLSFQGGIYSPGVQAWAAQQGYGTQGPGSGQAPPMP